MRKTTFVRDLPELGNRYQLVIYRGMPTLREKRSVWTREPDGTCRYEKCRDTTRLIGYVNRQGKFCFFYAYQMTGSKKYEASRKQVDLAAKTWIATNHDRKPRCVPLHEESCYFKFMKVAHEFYGDKILLNG